jgi:Ankyrin repeats (3 copies)
MALTDAQKTGLEAAILAYLAAEGGRFARTVAAFKEEAQGPSVGGLGSGEGGDSLAVSGEVLNKAWECLYGGLNHDNTKDILFGAIEAGDLVAVQLCVCVGVDVKELRYEPPAPPAQNPASPLFWAAKHDRLEIVQFFVKSGHDKDEGNDYGTSPLSVAAEEGNFEVVQYLVEQGADKGRTDADNDTALTLVTEGTQT